ncbi:MAG: hypothetical protein ACKVOX_10220 [Rhizobacter sp.]
MPARSVGRAVALEAVASDVWRVPVAGEESNPTNGGWVTQPVLVRDGHRLWLIASGPTPAQGARLRCAIERTLHLRVTDIVNTRSHPELALANVAFSGPRIWALADVAHAMRERCPQCLLRLQQRIAPAEFSTARDDSLRGAKIRVPDHLLGVKAGGSRDDVAGQLGPFRWWAFERAPGERTLTLVHRDSGWIVAQGLVWADGVPNLRETRLDPLMDSLRRLRALARPDSAGILGEQGGPGGIADIDRHLTYLTQLKRMTQAALERGEVEGATAIEVLEFVGTPGYAEYHALNRQRVWRELEQAWFK